MRVDVTRFWRLNNNCKCLLMRKYTVGTGSLRVSLPVPDALPLHRPQATITALHTERFAFVRTLYQYERRSIGQCCDSANPRVTNVLVLEVFVPYLPPIAAPPIICPTMLNTCQYLDAHRSVQLFSPMLIEPSLCLVHHGAHGVYCAANLNPTPVVHAFLETGKSHPARDWPSHTLGDWACTACCTPVEQLHPKLHLLLGHKHGLIFGTHRG